MKNDKNIRKNLERR